MINLDAILLDFIENNSVSLLLLFGFLKVLAQHSKSTLDDSIVDYLMSFFTKGPKEIKDLKANVVENSTEESTNEPEKDKISGGV